MTLGNNKRAFGDMFSIGSIFLLYLLALIMGGRSILIYSIKINSLSPFGVEVIASIGLFLQME